MEAGEVQSPAEAKYLATYFKRSEGVCKHKVLITVVFVCLAVSVSDANIIYVDANGRGEYPTIQDAVNDANHGDVIILQPGIYTGPGNYNIDPNGKSVTIRSTNPEDAKVIANTVIDPNDAGRGFNIHRGEDANCIISGLTIRNAYTGGNGGGIYCYNSSPTITNCVITGNYAGTHGGGLFCQNSNCTIVKCVIGNNSSANDGGGIECWRGKPVLTNCIIANNFANGAGGGADYFDCDNITLRNCTFAKNSANSGGALSCWDSSITVNSSIFLANQATLGSQIALKTTSSSVVVSYSDVEGGASAVYDPYNGLAWGTGNMDADPCFASFNPNGDPNLWDFHLQSTDGRWDPTAGPAVDLTKNGFVDLQDFAVFAVLWLQEGEDLAADFDDSNTIDLLDLKIMLDAYLTEQPLGMWVQDEVSNPCLDAGDPNSDWSAEPWPNGKRINMGAYGGTEQASKNGNIADLNIDGKVNFLDLAQLGNLWEETQETIEDLDNSGTVDIGDLDIFATNWLWEKQ